jgi:hypothetical protein
LCHQCGSHPDVGGGVGDTTGLYHQYKDMSVL